MKTISMIMHFGACAMFVVCPIFDLPFELAIMLELFAIFNNTQQL